MKKVWVPILVVAVVLILGPFVIPIFMPPIGVNCKYQDINIKTGQARYSRELWFVTLSERIEDTELSLLLEGEVVEVADIEPWHRVIAFSHPWSGYSPHYGFHGAFAQINQMMNTASMLELSQDRKKQTAREILAAWQKAGNDDGAREVINGLTDKRLKAHGFDWTEIRTEENR